MLVIADAVMMMADNVRYRLESQAYERLSREDGMTGLETRANFEKKLESISADMGSNWDILLMYIDIDQLRVINEEYGRAAGERDGGDLGQMCGERFPGKRDLLPHRRG